MLKVQDEGAVLRLTIARPEVRNALNDELIAALYEAFSGITETTRVVVLAGEGSAFCAGADLAWMKRTSTYGFDENQEDALKLAKMFRAVAECPAVVIARIQGAVFGGGAGLVAAADIAIASREARFAFSEVRIGLVPATISTVVLPKIGPGHARALFTTGEAFSARRAEMIGLVNEVVPAAQLDHTVEEKVHSVLSSAPRAVRAAKKLAKGPVPTLDEAATLLAVIRSGDEAKEGFAAFVEKRPAEYVIKP